MPTDISLQPSRYLPRFALLVLGLACLALARLPLSLPVIVLLALALLFVCYRDWRRQLPARATDRLSYQGEQWLLENHGEQRVMELTQATVWQWLVALNFREPGTGKMRRLVVLPDSCSDDDLRRLRVLLRHFPVFAA